MQSFDHQKCYGSISNYQVETDRISKYVLEIKDVLEFKDART